jgi:hypothetical protein
MPARATRWSSDFPRSRVIASAQRPALPRRSPGLAQCGLPAASPGQAYAARLAARPADLDGRGRHLRPARVRADGPSASWQTSCRQARQPGPAGRPEGDAAGAPGDVSPCASAAIASLDRPSPRRFGHRDPATKIGSQSRTPPLPESGQTDLGNSAWPRVRALTCGFEWAVLGLNQ